MVQFLGGRGRLYHPGLHGPPQLSHTYFLLPKPPKAPERNAAPPVRLGWVGQSFWDTSLPITKEKITRSLVLLTP